MDALVRRKLRDVRLLCSVGRLLTCSTWAMLIAGGLAVAAVLAEKLLATGLVSRRNAVGVLVAAAIVALVRWFALRPGRMQLAIELDQRAGLRERISSSLAFERSSDPFARAALDESRSAIAAVRVGDHFTVQAPQRIWWSATVWALAIALWLALPQGDLLGRLARQEQQAQEQADVQQATALVQEAAQRVKTLADTVGQDALADENPAPTAGAPNPQEARRAGVRYVAELRKRVERSRTDPQLQAVEQLQQKLRQLRTPAGGAGREFVQQLARGEFGQAAKSLRALQQQLRQGDLTEQQRLALSRDLEALAEQLQKLAERQWRMTNELKKLGLDPSLARDIDRLKQALAKLPMDAEQRRKLLEMAAASLGACRAAGGLGQVVSAAAGGLSGGAIDEVSLASIADLADQLDAFEILSQQMELADATLTELDQVLAKLCEGGTCCYACGGKGCSVCAGKGPWAAGLSDRVGAGMGGPGRGRGQVADTEETDTALAKTRVRGEAQPGSVIASWYIQDRQVRGESRRQWVEIVQQAEQEVAEAIDDRQIPKEYHEPIKDYFGRLRRDSGQPGSSE
jgi:hypothetical protein